MKRNLLRFGLLVLVMLVSLVTYADTGDKSYTNEAASVVWAFNGSTNDEALKTPEGVISMAAFSKGAEWTNTSKSWDGTTYTSFQPTVQSKSASEGNALTFSIKPTKGLTFTPTKVSAKVRKFGTDSGNFDVKIENEEGQTATLATGLLPARNVAKEKDNKANEAKWCESFEFEIPSTFETSKGFKLIINAYNLGTSKQFGLNDVQINGTVNGTVESVEQYTLNVATNPTDVTPASVYPSGDTFDAETEIKVTANDQFGYKFVNWTNAEGKEVSTEKVYTFTLTANTSLTANYKKVNTYALNYNVEGGAKDYMVSLSPAPEIVDGKNMYEEGTEVTLTASSNDILTFNNWSNGETAAEIKVTMDGDKEMTASYSAKDFIAAWDFYKEGKEGRAADFAAEENDAVQLVLRDADGNSYGWLDKSNSAGGYEGKNAAVNWTKKTVKNLGETYWQTKFNATAFTDIKVKSSMTYNYNAYETYNVEYSLDGKDWKKVGAINIQGAKSWTDGNFTLPSDANNQAEVYVRWIADKTSDIKGANGDNDGIAIAGIYITGTAKLINDGTAPVLVSSVPTEAATNASANGKIVLTFDEKVKLTDNAKATLNGKALEGTVSGKTITFAYKGLSYATAYTFTLAAGSVADLTDNAIAEDIVINFTTKTKPAVTKALYDFIVPTDGTFQEALTAAAKRTDTSKRFRIFIKQGDYKTLASTTATKDGGDGKSYPDPTTYLNTPNVSIIGEDMDNTSITNTVPDAEYTDQYGTKNVLEGIGKGDVLDLNSNATGTYFQDIKMYSSMGDSKGRDIVLNDKSNKTICKNVNFWAYQDTYVSNNQNGKFYFEGGILRGRTDYLCGKGDVYYNNVDLLMCEKGGYLAVPSQPKKYGYIFKDCTIKDASKAKDINGNYTLGRPWGDGTPIALFIDTKMEAIPSASGWNEMGTGWPKQFAEYNSTTTSGSVVDLSGRKTTFGDSHANVPVLTAEEAATYTLETVMGQDDDWDPTAATEQASAPSNVKITGSELTWDNSDYALLWAVCKDGKVIDFTTEPTYTVDEATATWSVRAANEMGGLGEATVATISTGIDTIATDANVLSTAIYTADGIQVSKLQKGINIVVKKMADGSKKTSKVVVK